MTDETVESASPGPGPTRPADRPGEFSLDIERRTLPIALKQYVDKLRTGDPGALPAVLGLIVLVIIFSQVSNAFLTRFNIGNLPGQGGYIAIIAMGLVFVLLLGEIDLSAGTAGGMAAAFAARAVFSGDLQGVLPAFLFWSLVAFMVFSLALGIWLKAYSGAVLVAVGIVITLTNLDSNLIPALIGAVALGAAVGIFNGWLVAKVGIPSFVVTLALFLAWQGMILFALNSQPIGVTKYDVWYGLANNNMSPLGGWIFTLVITLGYFGYTLMKSIRAQRAGLAADALDLVIVRGAVIVAVGVVLTALANENRNTNPFKVIAGIPWAASIAITLMILCTIALTKTNWGRHLYATGGNAEAARRAGIDVAHIRVTAFCLCSSFGAIGGIFLASSQSSASLDLGSGNILLFSVAAAVIGGTSLFGGRGKPRDAIIGALVIVIIPNGLLLKPSLGPQWQQVITGAVLLIAAAVDALSRRRAARV